VFRSQFAAELWTCVVAATLGLKDWSLKGGRHKRVAEIGRNMYGRKIVACGVGQP
jgi:hypothetical protein